MGTEECDAKDQKEPGCLNGQIVDGYKCSGLPSECEEIHGDGKIVGDEECDTNYKNDGKHSEGCENGKITNGWTCSGIPSVCKEINDDGHIVGE